MDTSSVATETVVKLLATVTSNGENVEDQAAKCLLVVKLNSKKLGVSWTCETAMVCPHCWMEVLFAWISVVLLVLE